MENSHVRFHKSSHQSKPVSKLLTLTGWAGKAFIRYRRCLLPKTKPREYQTVTLKGGPYLGLVDKVGNCISNKTEYYLGAMLAYLEFRTPDTFGWPQGMLYRSDLFHGIVIRMCMNTRSVHTSTSMFKIILVLLHPYQQV